MSTPANKLTADLLIEIPKAFPNVRIWRNNRVNAMVVGRGGKPRFVQAGIDGQGDLCGILGPGGKMIQIEIKAGKDRMRESQKNFAEMARSLGAIYIVATSVEQCIRDLKEYA